MALQISKQLPGFFQRIGVDWVIGNRTATILLLGIVILGVGLRMIRLQQVHLLERDEIVYLEMAEKWAAEGIDAVYLDTEYTIPPVLLFGMKILIGWGVPGIVAGKLCGMVTGGIFIIPFFFIGKLLFGKNSAGGSSALCRPYGTFDGAGWYKCYLVRFFLLDCFIRHPKK